MKKETFKLITQNIIEANMGKTKNVSIGYIVRLSNEKKRFDNTNLKNS